jgi:hypothetical protein
VFTLTALEPKEAEMRIIGVDLHARQQTVAMLDTKTGELIEKTLKHDGDEVRRFYSETNGFCERFHRTVKEEFYAVAFRKTFYESLEQLQRDLDEYLAFYNQERAHQGYRAQGRTPFQTMSEDLNKCAERR